MNYYYKYIKYKNKYLELKEQIAGEKNKIIVKTEELEKNKYYKPFGLYGLYGHKKIKDNSGNSINILNKRQNKIKQNILIPNNEINYIHELPIYDDNDFDFTDNLIIKHLLEHCNDNEYYKDIKSFKFIPYIPNIINENEIKNIEFILNKTYFTDKLINKDTYAINWLDINYYKRHRYKGLSPELSKKYLELYTEQAKYIYNNNDYFTGNIDLNNLRKELLNYQIKRECENVYKVPNPPEIIDKEKKLGKEKILLEDELIENGFYDDGKPKQQYLLSDFNLGLKYHNNPKISKDSYIRIGSLLGESGYNIMINKSTIACIAINNDILFPIRIILNMNPNTLFYENIYERTYLNFINKIKNEHSEKINIYNLFELVKDNKNIIVTKDNSNYKYDKNYTIDNIISSNNNNNNINIYNKDLINKIINILIINRYNNIDELINFLLKLFINNGNNIYNDNIINLFNYTFMTYFNNDYQYLGFWLLRYNNNYDDFKNIQNNNNIKPIFKSLYDPKYNKTHNSREQYFIFFVFKHIPSYNKKLLFSSYPNINFRNNKVDSGTFVELKKILYHEILQLMCLYYNKKIFFYVIIKNNTNLLLNCNLQNDFFNNKIQNLNCTNIWFSKKSYNILNTLKMGIENNEIHVLISNYNIIELEKKISLQLNLAKENIKLTNIKNKFKEKGLDEKENIRLIELGNGYNLFECYFDYEKIKKNDRNDRFVIKLGYQINQIIKKDACIYDTNENNDFFDFENERKNIIFSININTFDEIDKYKINNES
jgi:hypothetical protein